MQGMCKLGAIIFCCGYFSSLWAHNLAALPSAEVYDFKKNTDAKSFSKEITPNMQLGFLKIQNFTSRESILKNQLQRYSFPNALAVDQWALRGNWLFGADKIIAEEPGAALKIHFAAKKVSFLMASATGKTIPVRVLLDDQFVLAGKGKDVNHSLLQVNQPQPYSIFEFQTLTINTLQLIALQPGLIISSLSFS